MRKPPAFQLEEIPGNKYPDRSAAQAAGLPILSENLQTIIRELIKRGELMNDNGKIIPNPNKAKP